ncbi:flagellar export protein FliJ [Eoetvoesiella caeni]|uniref:Flagellar FliJ protein n=1 Tax=Eoetvoesiella caeni TaxID=645616 RepID=A0A366HK31_9BURK|nr:flagellar export protein FliJ [Eoetvoesiella caeni]MCI2807304.1 flagellar export protein FliJ [Eoetvoesiella caeni]NYT53301.1 flagellar export protein FliJ [Eoetvoesiella caeni]RBP43283.1 flagellar FliJ protein [Eoetvoesiella caeni]
MHKSNPLDTLIELTLNQAEQAERKLQLLTAERRNAQEQLSTLHVYRQDYAERLMKSTESGMSASNYHNFRQFIATLDEAISQQNRVVAHIDLKIEAGKKHWYAEKRRLSSFETLQARKKQQQRVVDNRNEQRANDEISANIFRRTGNLH